MLECFFCFENAVIENLFIVLHFTGIVILSHRYKQFFLRCFTSLELKIGSLESENS